jgi:formylglycine-generating enzyme required for sulfatase activity
MVTAVVAALVLVATIVWRSDDRNSTDSAATGKTVSMTLDLGGGVTMEFMRIPAGSFTMGSPKAEQDILNRMADFTITSEDQRRVRISKDFYLGKYPVTQEQYQALTGNNPSHFCATGAGKDKAHGLDTRRFPVESVSWEDAVAFCEKLSRPGKKVTLPTEAEWEYACRGGTKAVFYFGDWLNGTQANCDGRIPFGFKDNLPFRTTDGGPYLKRTNCVGAYEQDYPHPWAWPTCMAMLSSGAKTGTSRTITRDHQMSIHCVSMVNKRTVYCAATPGPS